MTRLGPDDETRINNKSRGVWGRFKITQTFKGNWGLRHCGARQEENKGERGRKKVRKRKMDELKEIVRKHKTIIKRVKCK